jgi:uncharacterized membrane protein YheB (UPF0754 family)
MNYWLLLIPVISAILGWFGSWIAGKILVYRIMPRHQQSFAEKMGKAVSSEFSFADIEKKMVHPDNVKKIMPLVEEHIDDFLRNKLKEKMPVVSMFMKEIEDLFPQVLKKFAGNLQSELKIESMVANKITSVSAGQIEKKLYPALRYFRLTGTISGLIIGVINMIIFLLMK